MTADITPLASVVLISNAGLQQVISDTLVIPSLNFGRSASDLITTCSFSVPGAHDIPLVPPQTLVLEYENVVRFHGVVTDCSITWQGGIANTTIEAADMSYLLSHKLVPVLLADYLPHQVGMCDFTGVSVYNIVSDMLTGTGIVAGDKVSGYSGNIEYSQEFEPGTTRLQVIQRIADEIGYTAFLYYTKVEGVYYSSLYFGPFSGIDTSEVL